MTSPVSCSEAPEIFVTYYSGNESRLGGEWIDASQDYKKIEQYINLKLLNFGKGAFINVTDYAYFYNVGNWLGETVMLERVVTAAHFILTEGEIGATWIKFLSGDIEKAIETFEDAYAGCYKDLEDFVREIHDDKEIPSWLENYVDWDQMGEDLILNGEIKVFKSGFYEVHVFWNRR
jgi:hypothetical protein